MIFHSDYYRKELRKLYNKKGNVIYLKKYAYQRWQFMKQFF